MLTRLARSSRRDRSSPRPGATDVARRAQCLYCELVRGHAEVQALGPKEDRGWSRLSAPQLYDTAHTLAERWGLSDALTRRESALIKSPLGRAKIYRVRLATWRGESMAVLLWALGRLPSLEPWHRSARYPARTNLRPESILDDDRFLALPDGRGAALRPRAAIDRVHRAAQLWTWRSRVRQLTDHGFVTPRGASVLQRRVRTEVGRAVRRGDVHAIDGDLAVGAKPYRCFAQKPEWLFAWRHAPERLRASAWLTGATPDWDRLDMRIELGVPLSRKDKAADAADFKMALECPADQRV